MKFGVVVATVTSFLTHIYFSFQMKIEFISTYSWDEHYSVFDLIKSHKQMSLSWREK